jgi:hypothetical protein
MLRKRHFFEYSSHFCHEIIWIFLSGTSLPLHEFNHVSDIMNTELQPVDPSALELSDFIDRDRLHEQIRLFVHNLLENDFEKLCSLMYRHDVRESAFAEALAKPTDHERSGHIATLVIERELKKMETRQAYKREKQLRLDTDNPTPQ